MLGHALEVPHRSRRRAAFALVSLVLLAVAMALAACGGSPATSPLSVRVLSSAPHLISGGDALLEVEAPVDAAASDIELLIDGRSASVALQPTAEPGVFRGLLKELSVGEQELQVKAGGAAAILTLVNYPLTGPILSGPHMTPYECRTVESGLGEPLDEDCSARTRFDWFYRTTEGEFVALDGEGGERPENLAETTTIDGATVPYVVRVESGTINRTIYRIAILDDPWGRNGESFTPAAGWNRRLAVSFGGGAGANYNQGVNRVDNALNDLFLSRGFAYAISTELVNRQHANAVLQGETLMMLKEHFIETYGLPQWTVGSGGSGGAIQQLVITQIYPGLLDGLQPSQSFPDSTLHTADCGLLQEFWRTDSGSSWSQEKKTAVEGYSPGTCAAWERSFVPVNMATNKPGCGLEDESLIYDPETNPRGARCDVADMRANIYGRDPETGFALRPLDNVGLQYGLEGLRQGMISVDEFLDLNEQIGGMDIDGNFIAERTTADLEALDAVYKSGLINSGGGGLANVPILHYRYYNDDRGDIHDRSRDLTIRARLEKANGRSDNQVIWVAPGVSSSGERRPVNLAPLALDVMSEWLDAMVADPAPLSTDKVVAHKPAAAVDAYFTEDGEKHPKPATWDGDGGFNATFPNHGEPRLVAGAPLANDVLKCALKPIDFAEYGVDLTAEQKERMQSVFPEGVCDWSQPGIGQGPIAGTYQEY